MGDVWMLYVSRASNAGDSRVEMILASPDGIVTKQSLHFSFKTLNNEAWYEALLGELRLAHELRVQYLKALSDSNW